MYHPPEQVDRTRLPRKGEVLGLVTQMHGGARMIVHCIDGKDRMCRVPGKIKKNVWVREGDYVLIIPWSIEPEEKGDIEYRYTRMQIEQMKRKGIIKIDF